MGLRLFNIGYYSTKVQGMHEDVEGTDRMEVMREEAWKAEVSG